MQPRCHDERAIGRVAGCSDHAGQTRRMQRHVWVRRVREQDAYNLGRRVNGFRSSALRHADEVRDATQPRRECIAIITLNQSVAVCGRNSGEAAAVIENSRVLQIV